MNIPGIVIHDAVAVAAVIDPSMFTWMKASVQVETQGKTAGPLCTMGMRTGS